MVCLQLFNLCVYKRCHQAAFNWACHWKWPDALWRVSALRYKLAFIKNNWMMSKIIMCKCMPANSARYLCRSVLVYEVFTKSGIVVLDTCPEEHDRQVYAVFLHASYQSCVWCNFAFVGGPRTSWVERRGQVTAIFRNIHIKLSVYTAALAICFLADCNETVLPILLV